MTKCWPHCVVCESTSRGPQDNDTHCVREVFAVWHLSARAHKKCSSVHATGARAQGPCMRGSMVAIKPGILNHPTLRPYSIQKRLLRCTSFIELGNLVNTRGLQRARLCCGTCPTQRRSKQKQLYVALWDDKVAVASLLGDSLLKHWQRTMPSLSRHR